MAINRILLHSRTIWEKSCQAASTGTNLNQIIWYRKSTSHKFCH